MADQDPLDDGVFVRETRQKRYIQCAGVNKTKPLPNKRFRPIPNANLDDVHKLRLHRPVGRGNRVRTIDLNKKPLPNVKMPAAKQLSTVKTEAEHYQLTNDQRVSLDRIAQHTSNPQHRNLLRSYVKGRPTRSLAPNEFQFLDKILADGCDKIFAERYSAPGPSSPMVHDQIVQRGSVYQRVSTSSSSSAISTSNKSEQLNQASKDQRLTSRSHTSSLSSMVQRSQAHYSTTNALLLDGTHRERNAESTLGSADMTISTNANSCDAIHDKRSVVADSSMVKRLVTPISKSLSPNGQHFSMSPPLSKSLPSKLLGNINANRSVVADIPVPDRSRKPGNKENQRKFFSSTAKHSSSKCELGSHFSTISSEEDFSSFEKQSSPANGSSPAQLLSPPTEAALANIAELNNI